MSHIVTRGPAPDDAAADRAWDQIMVIAEAHALIVYAYGGVATLALPREQRVEGLRDQVLRMAEFALEPDLAAAPAPARATEDD